MMVKKQLKKRIKKINSKNIQKIIEISDELKTGKNTYSAFRMLCGSQFCRWKWSSEHIHGVR